MSESRELLKFLPHVKIAAAAALAVTFMLSMPAYAKGGRDNCDKDRSFGNNGWGNGEDGENPGSFSGGGVSRGGPGEGAAQSDSKPDGGGR